MKIFSILYLLLFTNFILAQEVTVRQPVKFLALGDSYTIGQSVSQNESWPYQFKNYLTANNVEFDTIAVIARTGWTTSNLKNAINNENIEGKFNLVSLLIGVNNQYQGINQDVYITEFEELLNTAIHTAGGKEYVFVLSIPDYGYTPFGESNREQISAEINEYNLITEEITEAKGVAYFYITDISRKGLTFPSYVASDGLHPSGIMYGEWVDLIAKGLNVIGGVTSIEPKEIKTKNELKVVTNTLNKTLSLELETFPIENSLMVEIYTINGSKVYSQEMNPKTSFTLKESGIYLYLIKNELGIIYKGKVVIH